MHAQFAAFFPTGIAAVSFLMFNLFDSPCLAAISTMSREIGSKKFFWFAILFSKCCRLCIALMVYQIGGLVLGEVAASGRPRLPRLRFWESSCTFCYDGIPISEAAVWRHVKRHKNVTRITTKTHLKEMILCYTGL